MPTYRYRAAAPQGLVKIGAIEALSQADALERLRRQGLSPIEAVEAGRTAAKPDGERIGAADRKAAGRALSELSVLLSAGLSLDRALGVIVDTATRRGTGAAFARIHARVKEGAPLSRAMAESRGLFPPSAAAMAEAGEANGRLDVALARLAEALNGAEKLKETIISSLIYPAMLVMIALGVVGVMLFVVVPQFESLLDSNAAQLPPTTKALLALSAGVRANGLYVLLAFVLLGVVLWRLVGQPGMRARIDREILRLPLIGPIVTNAETARFARVLGSLIEGGVPVPSALAIARRSVGNYHMGAAIERVAEALKQGGGLTGPLAQTGVFPKLALSFLKTGEETARLGPMLDRLADVLDGEVRTAIGRTIGILTPAITVVIGVFIAIVIASLMTAILGFNQLALGPQ